MEKRHIGKVIKAFPSHLMSFEIKSQVPGWGEKIFVFKQGSGCFSRWLMRWIRKFPDITLSSLHPTHQLQTTFFHHFFCISHSHRLCKFTRELSGSFLNLEASSFECRNWVVFEQNNFLCNFTKLKSQILSFTFFDDLHLLKRWMFHLLCSPCFFHSRRFGMIQFVFRFATSVLLSIESFKRYGSKNLFQKSFWFRFGLLLNCSMMWTSKIKNIRDVKNWKIIGIFFFSWSARAAAAGV